MGIAKLDSAVSRRGGLSTRQIKPHLIAALIADQLIIDQFANFDNQTGLQLLPVNFDGGGSLYRVVLHGLHTSFQNGIEQGFVIDALIKFFWRYTRKARNLF